MDRQAGEGSPGQDRAVQGRPAAEGTPGQLGREEGSLASPQLDRVAVEGRQEEHTSDVL